MSATSYPLNKILTAIAREHLMKDTLSDEEMVGHDLSDASVVKPDHFPQVLRVEPGGQGGRAHQIAEHDGEPPAFGLCLRRRL